MEKILCFIINKENLYLEQVVVELDIPLLFICKDEQGNRYLSLCIDSEDLHYLVAEVSNKTLIDLLDSKITLRCPFSQSNHLWKIISENNISDDTVIPISFSQIPEIDLPQKNAFLDYSNQELKDYQTTLNNFKEELSIPIREQKITLLPISCSKHFFKNTKNNYKKNLDGILSSIDIHFKRELHRNKGEK